MDKALQTMIDNMPEKTGKSLEEWIVILKEKGFAKHSEGVKFLKTEHQVTHGFANTIVTLSKEENNSEEDLVSAQYKGKESLFPIYESLIGYVKTLGSDVTITPKKGSVSIIRKRQFILIKPATKTRIDLGFKLKDKPTTDRLENSGPFGTMCTHRVQLTDASQVDPELKDWIKEAYEKSV
jgi:predicted transport protein